MFRQFAATIAPDDLFQYHPSILTNMLEVVWQSRAQYGPELGAPNNRSNVAGFPNVLLNTVCDSIRLTSARQPMNRAIRRVFYWDHLIYAYMIEATRIYEIFRRVLFEFLHGEKLSVPTPDAQHWLRTTEELFYHDPTPFSILNIASHIRPDLRATRRNAYWRMFGMDLNHGTDDGKAYSYNKSDAANNEFVITFEEFLREVWIAYSNVNNTSGSNPTDRGKITSLVRQLHDMLLSRRESGNLSREEFVAVSAMSWFHLTVSYDSPIIDTLRANAASPDQRLFRVAQRVGLPAHGLSRNFFEIADAISRVLIAIESNNATIVPGLLAPGILLNAMNIIMTHWSVITGRDVKAGKVAVR